MLHLSPGGDDQRLGHHAGGLRPGEDQGPEDLQQPASQQAEEEAGGWPLSLPGVQQPVAPRTWTNQACQPVDRLIIEVLAGRAQGHCFKERIIFLCFVTWDFKMEDLTHTSCQNPCPGSHLREGDCLGLRSTHSTCSNCGTGGPGEALTLFCPGTYFGLWAMDLWWASLLP